MSESNEQPMITLNNGVPIPQLGLGVFQTPEGEQTANAVRWALQAGYRHIDTAKIYGNEASVGQGLRESGLKRREVFLTTKLWNEDVRAGRAKQAYEESLDRLGVDMIDLYLIHWPAEGWQQAWEDMQELYLQRRVRAIGVCNFQQHHLEELRSISDVKPAVDQIESSPIFVNQELIDYANGEWRVDVEAWSPLGGTGTHLLEDPRLVSIAAKYSKSPAQVVIRWHLQRGVIVIPKSVHQERIESNFDVFDFQLSDEDMQAVSSMDTGQRVGADPDHFDF
ncbi:2,5-didehydrogluconate reductase [Bifidobacterium actinocoloniiforme DSM 22766]|uniref:2,5-didehydrogluconate reductase n=1 Tax=Bifidobacterium actinocoloniiforme DSM 22766 TaxID=1437605 RepID=A0A086Z0V0_9BIFI|nr:aldo/keto reductase [Bifidobacterium actinocoloniiforme]KFI40150.1 2,5-didehydrogluconate reductase [Bifidobacterium actinocoloniiforme DSM 22766]